MEIRICFPNSGKFGEITNSCNYKSKSWKLSLNKNYIALSASGWLGKIINIIWKCSKEINHHYNDCISSRHFQFCKQGWGFGRPKLVLDRTGGFYRLKLSESVQNCLKVSETVQNFQIRYFENLSVFNCYTFYKQH